MKQRIYFGLDYLKKIGDILASFNKKNIFIIHGKTSFKKTGLLDEIQKLNTTYCFHYFSEFELNPKLEDVKIGLNLFKESSSDLILAVGGGSVIDMAKSISLLGTGNQDPGEAIKGSIKIEKNKVPLIVIPTTFGTGSEATHFSVLYVNGIKHSLAHLEMLPDCVVIDPSLALTLSRKTKASALFDALSQAVESLWSVQATEESQKYSIKAIKLLWPNLIPYMENTPNKRILKKIALGSHYAGRAINIAKTTACHALSYTLTSHFDVPHGQAASLFLPSFLKYNSRLPLQKMTDPQRYEYYKRVFKILSTVMETDDFSNAADLIRQHMKAAGLKTSLKELGITDKTAILNGVNLERMNNNPVLVTKKDLEKILSEL